MHRPRRNNSRRHRRRLSALAAAPAAAVASCLAALSLNRGDPTVVAFLAAGGTRSPAACFVARCGVAGAGLPAGRGRCSVTSVPVPLAVVTVSRRTGATGRPSSLVAGGQLAGGVDREVEAPWGAAGLDVSRVKFRRGAGVRRSMLTASAETDGGGGVGVDGADAGVRQGEGDPARLRKNLSKMMLPELKALYRAGGGKPGTLRKAELLERLSRPMLERRVASDGGGRPDEARPAAAVPASAPTLETVVETATSYPSNAVISSSSSSSPSSFSSSSLGGSRVAPPVGEGGGDTADLVTVDAQEDAAFPLGGGSAVIYDALETTNLAGASDAAKHLRTETSQIAYSEHTPGFREPAGVRESGPAGGGGTSLSGMATMSSGPAAVMSAARARGAAAQAASARVAGTRRTSEVAKARRHSESVRARAANAWRQTAEGRQQQRHGVLSSPESVLAEAATGNQGGQARDGMSSRGGWGVNRVGDGASAAPPAGGTDTSGISTSAGYRHSPPRQPVHMLRSNSAPGRQAATAGREGGEPDGGGHGNGDMEHVGGGGGPGGGGQANRARVGRGDARVRAAGAPRGNVRRARLMPKMPNPWTRAGRGGAAEGLSEEGDVVEEFLTDTMIQPSENGHVSSGDALFNRLVVV